MPNDPESHFDAFLNAAPPIGVMMRTDSEVAGMIDPAIIVTVGNGKWEARTIERLELIATMSRFGELGEANRSTEPLGEETLVLITDRRHCCTMAVSLPDPRSYPDDPIWTGLLASGE